MKQHQSQRLMNAECSEADHVLVGLEGQYFLLAQNVPSIPQTPPSSCPSPLTCSWCVPRVHLSFLGRQEAEGWRHLPWCHTAHRLWGVCKERADPRKEPPSFCQDGHSRAPWPTGTTHSGLGACSSETRMVPGKGECSATCRDHPGFGRPLGRQLCCPRVPCP